MCPRESGPPNAQARRGKSGSTWVITIDVIDDAPQDAIVPRLVWLLIYLDREFPLERWNRFLTK